MPRSPLAGASHDSSAELRDGSEAAQFAISGGRRESGEDDRAAGRNELGIFAYEQIINQQVRARLGWVHSASLLVRSYDFAHIERLQAAGDREQAGRPLAADAARLQDAGAQILVLATNTMHRACNQIAAAVSIPFPHIADVTGPQPGPPG
jgi:Asp/Glu/Hydantoin racemase